MLFHRNMIIAVLSALSFMTAGPVVSSASATPGCGQTVEEIATNKNLACAKQKLAHEYKVLRVDEKAYTVVMNNPQSTAQDFTSADERIEEDASWINQLETSVERIQAEHPAKPHAKPRHAHKR
jgi:hypothetical protein